MADNYGLFGPSADEIQMMQRQQLQQRGDQLAQMDPFARANSMIYSGAGGLMNALAPKMGMVNPQIQQAQMREQIMGQADTDLTTSQGVFAKADQFRKAGDLRTATALTLEGRKMKQQEDAAAFAARKQDFQENEAMQFKRDQLKQANDLKIMQLEQQGEIARQRSEDMRLSAQQRADAIREANQIKLMIAQMARDAKQNGLTDKPLTAAQQLKQKQAEAKSISGVRQLDDSVAQTSALIEQIKNHPGLSGATGIRSMLPSVPGSSAKGAENLIDEFKAQTALAGLNLTRQGGGIGAMTEKEWPLVERMVAAIDPKSGKDAMLAQMTKVLAKIEQIRENARMAHSETFGSDTSTPTMPTQDAIAAEIARRRGGK